MISIHHSNDRWGEYVSARHVHLVDDAQGATVSLPIDHDEYMYAVGAYAPNYPVPAPTILCDPFADNMFIYGEWPLGYWLDYIAKR